MKPCEEADPPLQTAQATHHMSGANIGVTGSEPDQDVSPLLIQPRRKRPGLQHQARHAGFFLNHMVDIALDEVSSILG